jgi:hypothetical protein
VVLIWLVAFLDARLAGTDCGFEIFLSHLSHVKVYISFSKARMIMMGLQATKTHFTRFISMD